MDPLQIEDDLLFNQFLSIPDDSLASPTDRGPSHLSANISLEVPPQELLPDLDFVNGPANPTVSDRLGNEGAVNPDVGNGGFDTVQGNPTYNVEASDPMDTEYPVGQTSSDQNQQNLELLTAVGDRHASQYLTPPEESKDKPFSDIEANPDCGGPADEPALYVQANIAQVWHPSAADPFQYWTAPLSFNPIQGSFQASPSFGGPQDASHSHYSPSNTSKAPLIASGQSISELLSTPISSMSNSPLLPYRQQATQPKPIAPYHPRTSSPILPTIQGPLADTSLPTASGDSEQSFLSRRFFQRSARRGGNPMLSLSVLMGHNPRRIETLSPKETLYPSVTVSRCL
jgi:hypothetical protein